MLPVCKPGAAMRKPRRLGQPAKSPTSPRLCTPKCFPSCFGSPVWYPKHTSTTHQPPPGTQHSGPALGAFPMVPPRLCCGIRKSRRLQLAPQARPRGVPVPQDQPGAGQYAELDGHGGDPAARRSERQGLLGGGFLWYSASGQWRYMGYDTYVVVPNTNTFSQPQIAHATFVVL